MLSYNLTVSPDEAKLILDALLELPGKFTFPTFEKLRDQIRDQGKLFSGETQAQLPGIPKD